MNCVLEETQKKKSRYLCLQRKQSDKHTFAVGGTHPEEAVYVLGEDGVPSVVCVRVGYGLDACSQELVPQQSSVGHCVCTDIRIRDLDTFF